MYFLASKRRLSTYRTSLFKATLDGASHMKGIVATVKSESLWGIIGEILGVRGIKLKAVQA